MAHEVCVLRVIISKGQKITKGVIMSSSDKKNNPDISVFNKELLGEYFYQIFESYSHTAEGKFVYITYIPDNVSIWSREAVEYFGMPSEIQYTPEEVWFDHIEERYKEEYIKNIEDTLSGAIPRHEMIYRARNREGQYVTVSCKGELIRDNVGNPIYFAGTLINHEDNETVDPVTGLYSRNNLMFEMQNYSKQSKPYYLMMLGIINFFEINGMYGYKFGNKLLKKAADILLEYSQNDQAYRCEGVKTALLFDAEKYSLDDLTKIYDEFRDRLLSEMYINDVHVTVELCGGAILSNDPKMDYNTVYNSALYALSIAKEENRAHLQIFENNLFNNNTRRLEILNKIRTCITEGFEGFYLCYQPIIEAKNGEVSGMEALLRWKDKKYGVVPPNDFIPWLEKDPIFFELGNWVIRRALKDTKDILKIKPDFVVNVNLAYPQLQRPDFKAVLNSILQEEDFPAENLKLELTERCRLRDMNMLRNDMIFFKSSGMQTALDDFGTGYSALNLLAELPVDQIKIDRSSVVSIATDSSKQSLLKAITTCANELAKHVCVEGIETREMKDYLYDNYTVTNFQGYFYSKPIQIDDFMTWMENYRPA